MTAAFAVDPWVPRPAAVHAVMAAAPRGGATKSASLAKFAEYGRVEAATLQGPLAGFLASLAFVTLVGNKDGLRLYSDVLVPVDECTFGEVRDAALRNKHRGQQRPQGILRAKRPGRERAPGGGRLRAGPELQVPIRSAAAARRTGQ